MMHSEHIKALNKLFDEGLSKEFPEFVYWKALKRASPMATAKMAYGANVNDVDCAILIDCNQSGFDAGFNFYIAWGSGEEVFFASRQTPLYMYYDLLKPFGCAFAESLWDPKGDNRRGTAFSRFSFPTRRVRTKDLIAYKGKIPYDSEVALSEVRVAYYEAWLYMQKYVQPFFKEIKSYIGMSYEDVAKALAEKQGI